MFYISFAHRMVAARWGLHGAGALIALALGLAAWQLGTRLQQEGLALDARHRETVEFFERAAQTQQQHSDVTNMVRVAERQHQEMLARAPGTPQESEFLNQLSALATQTGLEIRDFRPGRTAEQQQCNTMEVQVRGDGSYESLCRFLAGLESLSRLCRVAVFNAVGPTESGGTCTVDLQLQIFFAPHLDSKANPLGKP